jgi:hypothetical protein
MTPVIAEPKAADLRGEPRTSVRSRGRLPHAFTASNSVQNTNAGAGQGTISGYSVTNVAYTLNNSTPSNIDAVTFNISPAPSTSKLHVNIDSNWYTCTYSSGSGSCDTTSPQLTAAAADILEVVAAQ